MSIDWTKEAIRAAAAELGDRNYAVVRAALDAAVKAQGCILLDRDDEAHHARSYEKGRAEALEEAARVAWLHGDEVSVSKYDTASSAIAANRMAVNICATIRALKEKQG